MRKKIIKFYFFNKHYRNPSVNSMFSFSKRAMKQRKKNSKIKRLYKNMWNKRKRVELVEYYHRYTFLIKRRIFLNQWSYNNMTLIKIFLKSYFLNVMTVSKIFKRRNMFKKKLLLWFLFKLRYQQKLHKKLKKYPFLGYLSSHFVHTCARKNLTYQTRSKYRSKVFNTAALSAYVYTCSRMLLAYNAVIKNALYFFTKNPSKKYIWIDDEFFTQTSPWAVFKINNVPTINHMLVDTQPVNTVEFSLDVIGNIVANRDLLQQFFQEVDKTKKEALWVEITAKIDPNILDAIPFVYKMMGGAKPLYINWYNQRLCWYIKQYSIVYNL